MKREKELKLTKRFFTQSAVRRCTAAWSCGCPIAGGVQGWVGWDPWLPDLGLANLAISGSWNCVLFTVPFNPSQLQFKVSQFGFSVKNWNTFYRKDTGRKNIVRSKFGGSFVRGCSQANHREESNEWNPCKKESWSNSEGRIEKTSGCRSSSFQPCCCSPKTKKKHSETKDNLFGF